MAVSKRDKVLAVLDVYAEGGSLAQACAQIGLRKRDYYLTLRSEPELRTTYHQIQEDRADMMTDEAYEMSTDTVADPALRARADVRLRIAGFYNRARFGEKVQVTHEAGPSMLPVLEARKQRALRLQCDLETVIDVESEAIPSLLDQRATDTQSDAPAVGDVNVFEP